MTMATHSKQNVEMTDPAALYLRILVDGSARIFALDREDERVVAVGSASSADIQLERPGISPIHFYFERIENGIWIVPAYCVSELRVNTARVSSPKLLSYRSIVEFGNTQIVVEISTSRYDQVGTSPKPHDDRERIRHSYWAQLPDEDEPTHQPCLSSVEDEPTRQVWIGNALAYDACLERSTITLIAPKHSGNISQENPGRTEEDEDSNSELAKTLLVHPKSSAATKEPELSSPGGQLCTRADSPTASHEIVNVAPLNRTLLGIAPLILGVNEAVHSAKGIENRNVSLAGASLSPSQVATLFDGLPVPGLALQKKSCLTRLGLLTKRYPIRVCMAAVSIALAGSGLVIFTTKMLIFKAPMPAIGAPSARKLQALKDLGNPLVPPVSQSHSPPIVVVSSGPTRIDLAQDSSPKGIRPSGPAEFGSAALSVVQGHYADALVAYSSLAERSPADRTYVAISQLLARRLGSLCANSTSSSHPTSCPEIRP